MNGAYRYRVDVHLSAETSTAFEVDSGAGGGLHISARDVDGDTDLDLVITSAFGREPVGVWLNDGRGRFTEGGTAAYSRSFWRENEQSFEAPGSPQRTQSPFVAPAGNWTVEPAPASFLPFVGSLPAPVSADGPLLNALNPGSPLRAPPAR